MRVIRDALGREFTVSLTLPAVRRLSQGVTIEEGRVATFDFDHSDRELLAQQIEQITSRPSYAMDMLYALIGQAKRDELSFAQLIGEDTPDKEPWTPPVLKAAMDALGNEVLDFFQLRIEGTEGARRQIAIQSKQILGEIEAVKELSDDQFELAKIVGQLELDPLKARPIILAMVGNSPITAEQAILAVRKLHEEKLSGVASSEPNGGEKSTPLPDTPVLETSATSPIENSSTEPSPPANETAALEQQSPLTLAS